MNLLASTPEPAIYLSLSDNLRRRCKSVDLVRAARGADKALIADVRLFDVYAGDHVGPGRKSLAIEVTLQPREKTLTDEEIDAIAKKIVDKAVKATGGSLRG